MPKFLGFSLLFAFAALIVKSVAGSAAVMPPPPSGPMLAVLSELSALGGLPIAKLTPEKARLQPSAQDAANRLIKAKGVVPPITPVGDVVDSRFHANGVDVPVRIYTPTGSGPFPVLVYYHGGGWVLGDLNTYDASCRALTARARTIVVSVGYRLAPENKFPAAPNDAYAGLLWTQKNAATFKGDPKRIAVGGESAGGNLATVTSMMARDKHTPLPTYELLIYPVTNYAFDTPSYAIDATAKPLDAAMMHWFFRYYLRTPADGANPYVSPLRGNLAGLPPATVITDQIDPLMSEGQAYARKLAAAGVPVKSRNYVGVTHEFFGMGAVIPEAQQAEDFAATTLASGNARVRSTMPSMPMSGTSTSPSAPESPAPEAMPSDMASPMASPEAPLSPLPDNSALPQSPATP